MIDSMKCFDGSQKVFEMPAHSSIAKSVTEVEENEEAEAIEILKDIGLNANYMRNKKSRIGMACEFAIDTIRKYQKIEEIVKRYEHPDKEETDKFYWDIIGVVEDGL